MKIDRLTRVNELLRREIGEALYRLVDRSTFDLAAVTVTHVIATPDMRAARVLVSIRGHVEDRQRMLTRLQHMHGAIQREIAENIILKYTPKLHFDLDDSIESGDHILEILSKLPSAPEEETPPPHEP